MQPLSLLISRSDALPKSWRELIGQQDHVKGPHVNKTKNNNNKKPLVTTYWPTSGWVTEKIHYFSFSSNFAIDVFISTRESIFVISNGNDTNKETNQPTNRRTNEQIAKKKTKKQKQKKKHARKTTVNYLREAKLYIFCLTRPSQILTFGGKYSTDSVCHHSLSFVRIQFPCHIR